MIAGLQEDQGATTDSKLDIWSSRWIRCMEVEAVLPRCRFHLQLQSLPIQHIESSNGADKLKQAQASEKNEKQMLMVHPVVSILQLPMPIVKLINFWENDTDAILGKSKNNCSPKNTACFEATDFIEA